MQGQGAKESGSSLISSGSSCQVRSATPSALAARSVRLSVSRFSKGAASGQSEGTESGRRDQIRRYGGRPLGDLRRFLPE